MLTANPLRTSATIATILVSLLTMHACVAGRSEGGEQALTKQNLTKQSATSKQLIPSCGVYSGTCFISADDGKDLDVWVQVDSTVLQEAFENPSVEAGDRLLGGVGYTETLSTGIRAQHIAVGEVRPNDVSYTFVDSEVHDLSTIFRGGVGTNVLSGGVRIIGGRSDGNVRVSAVASYNGETFLNHTCLCEIRQL